MGKCTQKRVGPGTHFVNHRHPPTTSNPHILVCRASALVPDPLPPVPPIPLLGSAPFNSTDPTASNLYITATARVTTAWTIQDNSAAPPPESPACGTPGVCGPSVPVTLVPHGRTSLRIGAFPTA